MNLNFFCKNECYVIILEKLTQPIIRVYTRKFNTHKDRERVPLEAHTPQAGLTYTYTGYNHAGTPDDLEENNPT